ncbi:MAG: hypothetical protein K6T68_14290 [Alicyclobacillus shizuokensis]|nr:hypothetical protein [Alicyclobacillus shizuokensis]
MTGRAEGIETYIEHWAERVNEYLASVFTGDDLRPRGLFEAMNYSLLAGGKRLLFFL